MELDNDKNNNKKNKKRMKKDYVNYGMSINKQIFTLSESLKRKKERKKQKDFLKK